MYVRSFDWDEINENHILDHGVTISEVEESILLCRPFYQRGREDRYIAYVTTEEGRYLFIVFTAKGGGCIRVITARDMTKKEKRYYKKRMEVR